MTFRNTALGLLAGLAFGATAQAADIDHVLLISVDGLHALDVARWYLVTLLLDPSQLLDRVRVQPGTW